MENAQTIDSLRELRENAEAITKMPAFQEWKRQIEGQITGRQGSILEPLKTRDQVLEQEYRKGETVGLMHAVMQWNLMVEAIKSEIENLKMEESKRETEQPQA